MVDGAFNLLNDYTIINKNCLKGVLINFLSFLKVGTSIIPKKNKASDSNKCFLLSPWKKIITMQCSPLEIKKEAYVWCYISQRYKSLISTISDNQFYPPIQYNSIMKLSQLFSNLIDLLILKISGKYAGISAYWCSGD